MSAPYHVSYRYSDGHKSFPTLAEAIDFARTRTNDISVRIYGDGAEGGYGDDGTQSWGDGGCPTCGYGGSGDLTISIGEPK